MILCILNEAEDSYMVIGTVKSDSVSTHNLK